MQAHTVKRYELVDLSVKIAASFMSQGRIQEAGDELARATLWLQELKRIDSIDPDATSHNEQDVVVT